MTGFFSVGFFPAAARPVRVFASALPASLLLACAGDHLIPAQPADPGALYWALELNHHAVTLSMAAPYDTLTVAATPHNVQGETLPGFGTPQYSSSDLDHVEVTSDGVLRAVAPTADGQPIAVTATLIAGNLKHIDTVLVRVVDNTTPPVLSTFSIHSVPPDSAKFGMPIFGYFGGILPVRATDAAGAPIADLLVYFRSSDTTTAVVDRSTGEFWGQRPGPVTFYASSTAFGVTRADTLSYRIGWPLLAEITIQRGVLAPGGDSVNVFTLISGASETPPPEVRVGVGSVVIWHGPGDTTTTDVTFSDADVSKVAPGDSATVVWTLVNDRFFARFGIPGYQQFLCSYYQTDCGSGGSFVLAPPSIGAMRAFPVPGTYEYHSARYGTGGRIVVVDEH